MIPESKWVWFGNPGHFICSRWCRFHLCTVIGKHIISTVGEYVHPMHGKGNEKTESEWVKDNYPGEDIGLNRKFETMVFLAGTPCNDKDCDCGLPDISGSELDFEGYQSRCQANKGHIKMCREWAKREATTPKATK